MSIFKVTIENFEGPIDVLLQMIEKRKLPINDISLVDIADDYIAFISSINSLALSERTQFVFVASTLTLIKSKSLLPTLELTDDEEGDIESLKRRLNLFKVYQTGGDVLKDFLRKKPLYYFARSRKKEIKFQPHSNINLGSLLESMVIVCNELPTEDDLKKEGSVTIAVHIERMMESLVLRIKSSLETNFNNFIAEHLYPDMEPEHIRVYKVVGFLAMLELVKNGAMHVQQSKNFSNINIEKI